MTAAGARAQSQPMTTVSPMTAPVQQARDPLAALLGRGRTPLVMGILNVTPDSFSDGGRFFDPDVAIAHARAMIDEGADILDVGAESTRPYGGNKGVGSGEELARLKPVLPEVAKLGVPAGANASTAGFMINARALGEASITGMYGRPKP